MPLEGNMFLLLIFHWLLQWFPLLHSGLIALRDLLAALLPVLYDLFVVTANIIRAVQIYRGIKPKVMKALRIIGKRVAITAHYIIKPLKKRLHS